MVKMARLPNTTFAVADLDPSGERLSRVPPRDTDAAHCPPALSKSAGPRSTGVEAMKMRAKYLFLAIALLCLLALPATALAADDNNDSSKIDTSVTTVLDATGGDEAVPVIVYTEPGAADVVDDAVPAGVETTGLCDAVDLQQGVGLADVRVESGGGCRVGVLRDLRLRNAVESRDRGLALLDQRGEVRIVRPVVGAGRRTAVIPGRGRP